MIKQAKFITSVAELDKLPDFNCPEIAIVGKSNVGKSSFINMMVGQKKLAKTSSEPGRTRLINFFEINNGQFFFVDLPGYGFAKVGKEEKKNWGRLIDGYLVDRQNLINVFVLVDIRRIPSEDDKLLLKFLYAYGIPMTIIATKADKLSKLQQSKARSAIATALGVGPANIIMVSSETGQGKDDLIERIDVLLASLA